MPNIVAIIPAYNEQQTIRDVIRSVRSSVDRVIVINDGSSDKTADIADSESVIVINHRLNCGLGAALSTGLAVARTEDADIAVTIDADGQLFAEDIKLICEPIISGRADIVIGSRFLEQTNKIPPLRRLYNRVGNLITRSLFGVRTSDSQSGIRGFNRKALASIEIRCSRMEVSSEFFEEIKHKNMRWVEVPIRVQYTAYSLSKGQNFIQGIRTVLRLAVRRSFHL